jgi:Family of unknown function (DUF5682)
MGTAHFFGVRHHGPGSARSLERALAQLEPDCVLIEGPPDAAEVLPLASHVGLTPPVALLVYVPEAPRNAVFYPFAEFSPEWRAIRLAQSRGVTLRFIDLPQSARLKGTEEMTEQPEELSLRQDPLEPIARAAGYSDAERWWDHLVESRSGNDLEVFTALHELMTAVRKELPPESSLVEQRREAHMRRAIRTAKSEGFERIAVVCGAYHTPALDPLPPARADDALLKGLPKVKTAAAWVPWSYERLSYHSGYGAGVESPVWYELLFKQRHALGAHWLGRAARLLREEDVPISSAHVIEACRLAESLAALRERPVASLSEYRDAAVAVLGEGNGNVMKLIGRRWYYGSQLGSVPEEFPAAPLARDLAAQQSRLRLPPKTDEKRHELDLRENIDRERSHLLRRLRILGVEWGTAAPDLGKKAKGTFHEHWLVRWQPEFAVRLIEASRYGHTILEAASVSIIESAAASAGLDELVRKLEDVLFADLAPAIAPLVAAIQNRTALASDVQQLLEAMPPLVEVARYGNVRGTDVTQVNDILAGLIPRMLVGLLPGATGIDANAGRAMYLKLVAVNHALNNLGSSSYQRDWLDALARVADAEPANAIIRGYASRLLYDAGRLKSEQLETSFSLSLSLPSAAVEAALWIEGLLSGGGTVLVHDDGLRNIIDRWLAAISPEHFIDVLPLLRRSFAQFSHAERRLIGHKVRGGAQTSVVRVATDFDEDAARAVLPTFNLIWGGGEPS